MTVQDPGAWVFPKMYRNKYSCCFRQLDTGCSKMNLNRLKLNRTQATEIFDKEYAFNLFSFQNVKYDGISVLHV